MVEKTKLKIIYVNFMSNLLKTKLTKNIIGLTTNYILGVKNYMLLKTNVLNRNGENGFVGLFVYH